MRALVLSCCSTPVICTSCWVNWLESSGAVGSWFCNCVVSSVRKVLKLLVRLSRPAEVALETVFEAGVVGVVAGGVVVVGAVTVMVSSDPDIDAGRGGASKGGVRG